MDNPLWLKIASAILIVAIIAFLWPRAKYWMDNSPKAEKGDWAAVALPIGGVVLLVLLLILSVR